MKEKEKKAVEAEIEKKACCEVSDNEVEGVTGGLSRDLEKNSANSNDKLSIDSSKLSLADDDKLALSGYKRSLSSKKSDKVSLN